MIDHLIHFYKSGSEPFRSLSALSDSEATQIMQDLYIEGSVYWERFEDPSDYLRIRRQVEQWLLSRIHRQRRRSAAGLIRFI